MIYYPQTLVRSLLKRNYWEHSHALFTFLKLIKLNEKLETGNMLYNYVHRSLPHYLSDIFTFTHDIHIHETRHTSHIRPFTSLTVKSSNSCLCKCPLIWNRIPFTIQQKNKTNFCSITKSNCCKRV